MIITSLTNVQIINRKWFKLCVKELQCPAVCVEPINTANLLCLITAVSEGNPSFVDCFEWSIIRLWIILIPEFKYPGLFSSSQHPSQLPGCWLQCHDLRLWQRDSFSPVSVSWDEGCRCALDSASQFFPLHTTARIFPLCFFLVPRSLSLNN